MTKVKIDGKVYCVETLIHERERLIKEVKASAELHRLVLDKIRAEIMKLQTYKMFEGEDAVYVEREDVLQIIDKYKAESEEEE